MYKNIVAIGLERWELCIKDSVLFLCVVVLLYVREKSDPAFTALMLLTPTMDGLAKAVSQN